MEEAIAACDVDELGIEHCAPFASYQNLPIPPCMPSGLYPNEDVGIDGKILSALPGCNPIWSDNSTKPTCAEEAPVPKINRHPGPNLDSWNYVSCPFSYTDAGLILTAHKRTDWTDMTTNSCLAECKGYKYAMME